MTDLFQKISTLGIIPVVAIHNAEHAVPLAKALKDGGLPVAEITFRTPAAEQAIKNIAQAYPDMLLGAGTVLTTEQVDRAINAGATFIVSPGLNPKVVQYCLSKNIPITPGISNPSDIEAGIELGLKVLKYFPAEAAGGLKTLGAMAAPYNQVKFIPTGGINAKNINQYLAAKYVLACGGSWMVSSDLINDEKFNTITELTREAVTTMLGFEPAHIGINANGAQDSLALANTFSSLFGIPVKEGNSSNFVGENIEINKSQGLGTHGHIAISTYNIPRAIAFLSQKGITFDSKTEKKDPNGNVKAVYLNGDYGGFAIHLLQKKPA